MTINDKWLLKRAHQNKAAALAAQRNAAPLTSGRLGAPFAAHVDQLWASLQAETRRQAGVYAGALGDPGALVATADADVIDVRAADGRQVTIRLDRARQALRETFRNRAGAVRMGRPRIRFAVAAAGHLAFNFGTVETAASSILRRVID